MAPAIDRYVGDTVGISAFGRYVVPPPRAHARCTNCAISGAACDLPQRTAFTKCLCNWYMSDADRAEQNELRRNHHQWMRELGRPIRDRWVASPKWLIRNDALDVKLHTVSFPSLSADSRVRPKPSPSQAPTSTTTPTSRRNKLIRRSPTSNSN
jgi:hypothetical protein